MKEVQVLLSTLKESNPIYFPSTEDEQELVKKIEYADKLGHLFASGNCFYFIMNFLDYKFDYISNSVYNVLGMKPEDASLNGLLNAWHPGDLEKMSVKESIVFKFLYEYIPAEDIMHYKVSYINRLKNSDGTYKKILHQATTMSVSMDNKIERTFCVETDVSHLNLPMSDTVTFLGLNGRKNFVCEDMQTIKPLEREFARLSPREIEIISYASKGYPSKQIADMLTISVHTVNTHKRNVMNKTNSDNMIQVITDCLVKGIL